MTKISATERSRKFRQRQAQLGRVKIEAWVPKRDREALMWLVGELQAGRQLMRDQVDSILTQKEETDLMGQAWDVGSLKAALETDKEFLHAGELTLDVIEGSDPALICTMHYYGDLEVVLSIVGEQIVASALLWPVDQQTDRAAFNEFILKAHKNMPLSTFGITTVDGTDHYELFGALSAHSVLKSIVIELRSLASNAIDVTEDLHPHAVEPAA